MTIFQMQAATVVMGMSVMVLTAGLAFRFYLVGKPLSRAFTYNLCGEFIASGGTTIFSWLQILGVIDDMKPGIATAIRLVMFLGMLLSSLHMAFLIRKIEHQQ